MFRCHRALQSSVRRLSTIHDLLSRTAPSSAQSPKRSVPLGQRVINPPTMRILKPPSLPEGMKQATLTRPKRDEEIVARYISYVDAEGKLHPRCRTQQVLSQFDRTRYFLVEVDPSAKPNPVCRLLEKKAMFEKEKSKKRGKTTAPVSVLKEVSFGWNVSAHDMEHKLNKACQFLEKGNRVKLDIVYKKGQNRVDQGTQQEVIKSVTGFMDKYKLAKQPAINGHTCTMQYENK
ncbi:hypothetical protein BY458DRAFT_511931 [Sporodiniella umbellata]|nr:hypothetical protein BY458DRAFT_511931 [Sporodiniella umbellata]